jgi:Mitochondrial inner membrane protein
MTDQTLLPPPDEPQAAPVATPKPRQRNTVAWLYGLGFLILAVAIFYIWRYPSVPGDTAGDATASQYVEQRLADIAARLKLLEQRPNPDLGKINGRLDILDGRVGDQTQIASRMDTLSGRIESLSGRDQTAIDAVKQQLDALTARIAALDSNSRSVDDVTKRLEHVAKLQEASLALAVGRPVGDLSNAPEALARYAHAAPPTESDLRLGFPQAKQSALATTQPDAGDAPFVNRIWTRAQGLLTIRRGDEIVIGNPSALVLNRAQTALDAGDLAGAVRAVQTLKGQPLQAMADWLAEAQALLNARSALAEMANRA